MKRRVTYTVCSKCGNRMNFKFAKNCSKCGARFIVKKENTKSFLIFMLMIIWICFFTSYLGISSKFGFNEFLLTAILITLPLVLFFLIIHVYTNRRAEEDKQFENSADSAKMVYKTFESELNPRYIIYFFLCFFPLFFVLVSPAFLYVFYGINLWKEDTAIIMLTLIGVFVIVGILTAFRVLMRVEEEDLEQLDDAKIIF